MLARLLPLLLFPAVMAAENVRPGVITGENLVEYAGLSGLRKKIVDEALALAARGEWLKYQFGGEDPAEGGLDCSGSVHFVLSRAGMEPPRTSAAQFTWVKEEGALREVPAAVATLDDPLFDTLKPGDLLFWTGTYTPRDGREVAVSHVQIFLGHEKSDNRPVMIGSSDGRSYRGIARNGYGVFDFRLPRAGSKGKFLGFGLPEAGS
ncbi:C40 family peptidase [Luteolibacter marinus]|uniref:C40 family peptidase n=1 Tax=Luteolibacter marinus TaxID=2776705 RepID=UPI001865B214|nr:NlpC/P60 family protein [Luteolibacter marinus]